VQPEQRGATHRESPRDQLFQITALKGSFETFGVVLAFLSSIEPFARYDLGNFARAIQHQLANANHLAAVKQNRLVGYCGWLPAKKDVAEAWMAGGPLVPADRSEADSVVLTVVAADNRRILTGLLRRARELNPNRQVFFKRQYANLVKPVRKSAVRNVRR
jgi:hypothetical protein